MIKIGITGNIGSGKTTFAKLFETEKSFIFNADKEAKKHLKKHSVLQKKLINIFGSKILTSNNLDFKKLAEIAFKNKNNQKILNGIIWPEVSLLIVHSLREAKKERFKCLGVTCKIVQLLHRPTYIYNDTDDTGDLCLSFEQTRFKNKSKISSRLSLYYMCYCKKEICCSVIIV